MAHPKSVFITGCSKGGIGDGLAREFHARGLVVFATTRNRAKMTHLEDLGIHTIEMDVTDANAISKAVTLVRECTAGRGLDILINNAGVYQAMPFMDTALDDIRRVFETNVFGVLAVTQAFLPLIIEAKGMVANIGSINEVIHPVFSLGYNASKAAMGSISATLRQELRPFGVKVVHVRTGAVKTGLTRGEGPRSKLPADSLYAPSRKTVDDFTIMRGYENYQTPEQYAKGVANDLLGNPGPVIWRGAMTTLMRILNVLLFIWPSLLDSMLAKSSGFVGVTTEKTKLN